MSVRCLWVFPGTHVGKTPGVQGDTPLNLCVWVFPGTPVGKTPGVQGDTPLNLQNVDPAAIQRAAAGLQGSVLNALQQVVGQHTPFQTFQV